MEPSGWEPQHSCGTGCPDSRLGFILDQLSDFNEKSELEEWVTDYYRSIEDIAPAKWKAFYEK